MSIKSVLHLHEPDAVVLTVPRQVHSSFFRFLGLLLSEPGRLLRFAATGAICGGAQILLLHVLTELGWSPTVANATGFLLSAQLNFLLSYAFTWGDRNNEGLVLARLARAWLAFHGNIAGTGLLNLAAFTIMRTVVPNLLAAAIGIGVASFANYILNDRLVFRPRLLRQRFSDRLMPENGPVATRDSA